MNTPLRKSYVIDGMTYEVVQGHWSPVFNKRRWDLRIKGQPGAPEAKVYLDSDQDIDSAAKRLGVG